MQQIVAACGAESWRDQAALFNVLPPCLAPTANLTREHFDELIDATPARASNPARAVATGPTSSTTPSHGQLHRPPRLPHASPSQTAEPSLTAGHLQPSSSNPKASRSPRLTSTSPSTPPPETWSCSATPAWRIQRVESARSSVLVEDAHGAPPSLPFWEGEAPQRTAILCDGVGDLRAESEIRARNVGPRHLGLVTGVESARCLSELRPSDYARGRHGLVKGTGFSPSVIETGREGASAPEGASAQIADTLHWLQENCFVPASGALQLHRLYCHRARRRSEPSRPRPPSLPSASSTTAADSSLSFTPRFGGRLNKAWGLALRKRFCRGFNFELQAAATDNGINISLAEQHSFPALRRIPVPLRSTPRRESAGAGLPSLRRIFKNRWRWAAGRSVSNSCACPERQAHRAADPAHALGRSSWPRVFPQAAACFETIDRRHSRSRDHPLV